jgi:hypothetical protein
MGALAVSKHEPRKIDFELINDAIMKCLAKAFAMAMMLAFGTRAASAQTLKAVQFTALQSGEVDVLARNTTWTMSRDTTLGLDFRCELLRRSGLYGPKILEHKFRPATQRCCGLCAAGYDHRA